MVDNVQLKRESVVGNETVLESVYPKTNTAGVNDPNTGRSMDEILTRLWNAINNQLQRYVNSVNGRTGVVVLNANDIGLGNVDNISFDTIKSWVLDEIKIAFQDHRLLIFNNLGEVNTFVQTHDETYKDTVFYAEHIQTDTTGEVDLRAAIGYLYLDDDQTLKYEYRALNTIGFTDDSLIYNQNILKDDGTEMNLAGGGLGVNIRDGEEALKLYHSSNKRKAGLWIDKTKVQSNVYFAHGMYGDNTSRMLSLFQRSAAELLLTQDENAMLYANSSMSGYLNAPLVQILINGEPVTSDLYRLRWGTSDSSHPGLAIGDLIFTNFAACIYYGEQATNNQYEVLLNTDVRLMSRNQSVGHVESGPTEESPNAPYVINFTYIQENSDPSLKYMDDFHSGTDELGSTSLTVATGQGLNVFSSSKKDPDVRGFLSHYKGYRITGISISEAGSGYTQNDFLRLKFSNNSESKIILVVTGVTDDENSSVLQLKTYDQLDDVVLDTLPITSEYRDYRYNTAIVEDPVSLLNQTFDTEYVWANSEDRGSGCRVTITAVEEITFGRERIGLNDPMGIIANANLAEGLHVTTDSSLAASSIEEYGGYIDFDHGQKAGQSDQHDVGLPTGSRKIANWAIDPHIPNLGLQTYKPRYYGMQQNPNLLGVNLTKLISEETDTQGNDHTYFQNLSGLKKGGAHTDYSLTNNDYYKDIFYNDYLGMPDRKNSSYVPVEPGSRLRNGTTMNVHNGLSINNGRFLEIDPTDATEFAKEYYQTGKVNVRIGKGLTSQRGIIPLSTKPADWDENDIDYYVLVGDELQLKALYKYRFSQILTQPATWEYDYKAYYKKNAGGKYVHYTNDTFDSTNAYRCQGDWYLERAVLGKYFKIGDVNRMCIDAGDFIDTDNGVAVKIGSGLMNQYQYTQLDSKPDDWDVINLLENPMTYMYAQLIGDDYVVIDASDKDTTRVKLVEEQPYDLKDGLYIRAVYTITTLTVVEGGTGYVVGDVFTIEEFPNTDFEVSTIDDDGVVLTVAVHTQGEELTKPIDDHTYATSISAVGKSGLTVSITAYTSRFRDVEETDEWNETDYYYYLLPDFDSITAAYASNLNAITIKTGFGLRINSEGELVNTGITKCSDENPVNTTYNQILYHEDSGNLYHTTTPGIVNTAEGVTETVDLGFIQQIKTFRPVAWNPDKLYRRGSTIKYDTDGNVTCEARRDFKLSLDAEANTTIEDALNKGYVQLNVPGMPVYYSTGCWYHPGQLMYVLTKDAEDPTVNTDIRLFIVMNKFQASTFNEDYTNLKEVTLTTPSPEDPPSPTPEPTPEPTPTPVEEGVLRFKSEYMTKKIKYYNSTKVIPSWVKNLNWKYEEHDNYYRLRQDYPATGYDIQSDVAKTYLELV